MQLNDAFEKNWFIGQLQCPDCRSGTRVDDVEISCGECNRHTPRALIDLRPVRPHRAVLELDAVSAPTY